MSSRYETVDDLGVWLKSPSCHGLFAVQVTVSGCWLNFYVEGRSWVSPDLGKGSLSLIWRIHRNSHEALQLFFGVIRGELGPGGTTASPLCAAWLRQPEAPSAGRKMSGQSTSEGAATAFVALN